MRRITILAAGMVLAACGSAGPAATPSAGGGGEPAASTDGGNLGGGGNVVNPQPPGQATVSVDGVEFTFDAPPLVACSIGDGFNYSFTTVDGKATLAAGGQDFGEDGWGGSINFTVTDEEPDPESGELGFVKYIVFLRDADESSLAFAGDSMSFSGPMLKQTPGSAPPGEDAGTGTISVTCP